MVVELVPRYGNVVLLRDRVVVATAKQFSPAENEARSVQVGLPYEAPPLPQPALDAAGFAAALERAGDAVTRARALGGYLPELPRFSRRRWSRRVRIVAALPPAGQAAELEERARAVLAEAERAAAEPGDLFLYRRDDAGAIAAVHVVPLAQHAALPYARVASVLDVFREARAGTLRVRSGDATERRRAALLARVAKRAKATDGERGRPSSAHRRRRRARPVAAKRRRAVHLRPRDPAGCDELRTACGSGAHDRARPRARRQGERAALLRANRKAADALPHLERRREALATRRSALEVLAFEVERADSPTIPELEADLDALEGRPPQRAPSGSARRRPPLRLERPSGARIYVGRSPRENAEITFRIAKPDDLWFHARGIPGSHVVLQAPPAKSPATTIFDAAANLAATHSKARNVPRVEIDYTERKHVRKQRDGAPGLVWYTNARTSHRAPFARSLSAGRTMLQSRAVLPDLIG